MSEGRDEAAGERLQKLLARAGIASRRKAEALVRAGRVTVNGAVASLGDRATVDDDVRLDGRRVTLRREHVTYLLYKPVGVVSTAHDELGRTTVVSLVPRVAGLHPVGRLDRDSEGLLLLTTDGALTLRLSHPRYGHVKEYRAWCAEGRVREDALARLRDGVDLEDGPARAVRARGAEGGCVLELGEGRNRQVRRMLAALGYEVTRLKRTRIGGLRLGDLQPGDWRELTPAELTALRGRGG